MNVQGQWYLPWMGAATMPGVTAQATAQITPTYPGTLTSTLSNPAATGSYYPGAMTLQAQVPIL